MEHDKPIPSMTSRQLAGFLIYTLTALQCQAHGETSPEAVTARTLAVMQGMLQELEVANDEMHMHAVGVGEATMNAIDAIVAGDRPLKFKL